ncbi:MAG: cyclic nucleotide-binding domain-containing protein [bacterium]|jgi:CRP-like cAMP-binding protein
MPSSCGDDLMLCALGEGEVSGENDLLAQTERTATVVAVTACDLIEIERLEDCVAF